jgi:membrane protease YdiL (CAAX protease family)
MGTASTPLQRRPVSFATWIGLLISLIGLPASTFALRWLLPRPVNFILILVLIFALEWIAALAILAIVLLLERQPLSSIHLQWPTWKQTGWSIIFWVLGLCSFAVSSQLVRILGLGTINISVFARVPLSLRLVIPLTAGVCEELLFRGYVIERVRMLTGSIWLGAVISLIGFTVAHLAGFGLAGAIQIGVWAIVVTLLYVWQRNVVACMLMHALNDAYAYVLIPLLFRI